MDNQNSAAERLPFPEFYRLEKEMGLFSLQYRGVNYWQFVRFEVCIQLSYAGFTMSCVQNERNFIHEILGAFSNSVRMQRAWKTLGNADLIRIRPRVTLGSDGKTDDHMFDYVSFGDEFTALDIYALGNYVKVPDVVEYSMASAEAKLVLWKIKRKLFGQKPIDKEQELLLGTFLSKLTELYGVKFSLPDLLSRIQYAVICHLYYRKAFLKLFKKASPRAVMLYPHYDDHMHAAIAAARALGIKTVEVQHGETIGHCAYWYEDRSAEGKTLPDYFFSYGQWWIEQIRLPESVTVLPIGNPYFEAQCRKYPAKPNSRAITFFSNTISGKDLEALIAFSYDAMTRQGYHVVFKLHPREVSSWKTEYRFLAEHPEIRVVEGGSIYELISESAMIVGIRSTVFYEALQYDNVAIILDKKGGMDHLIDGGLAYSYSTEEEFRKFLDGNTMEKKNKDFDKTLLWAPHGIERTVEMMRQIMSE